MKIIGTDIYIPHCDSFDLTINLDQDFDELSLNLSFENIKIEGRYLSNNSWSFSIDHNITNYKPGQYEYNIVGIYLEDGVKEVTTIVKRSLFVIEETARSVSGVGYEELKNKINTKIVNIYLPIGGSVNSGLQFTKENLANATIKIKNEYFTSGEHVLVVENGIGQTVSTVGGMDTITWKDIGNCYELSMPGSFLQVWFYYMSGASPVNHVEDAALLYSYDIELTLFIK